MFRTHHKKKNKIKNELKAICYNSDYKNLLQKFFVLFGIGENNFY